MENNANKFGELVNSLEPISEDQHGMLVGGFASAGSGGGMSEIIEGDKHCTTNNCDGGNCVAGCGGIA